MSKTEPTVVKPASTNSRVALEPGAGAASPLSWTINDKALVPVPGGVPHEVSPTPYKDDVYKVVDKAGETYTAVIAWKPSAPVTPTLKAGRGNASVSWTATDAEEKHLAYYEVDLKDPAGHRPTAVHLPRRAMEATKKKGSKRVVQLDGLPPGVYSAQLRATRTGSYGAVKSDAAGTSDGEVLPVAGPYPFWGRVILLVLAVIAVAGAVILLSNNPRVGYKVSLDSWALGVATLVVLGCVLALSVIRRIRDLVTGSDNRISTTRINVAVWTVVIAFGITTLAAFAFGAHQYHQVNPCELEVTGNNPPDAAKVDGICVDGNAIAADQFGFDTSFKNGLAPNYLVLLGTPFVTLAGSAYIVNRQINNGDRQKVQSHGPSSYVDALTNDDGNADLVDSQYLIFTGVLLFYFLTSFIPNPTVLPDLPWSLVGLTGVSAGTYLLNKGVTTNGLSVQGLVSNSVKQGASARVLGRNFLPDGSDGLVNGGLSVLLSADNGSFTPTITKVSNTDVTFTVNVPPGTYNTSVTTAANVSASAGALIVSV